MNNIFDLVGWLTAESPLLAIWLLGMIVAATRWKKHPKVSLLTILALGGLSLELVTMQFVYRFVLPPLVNGRMGMDIGTVYKIIGFVRAVINAGLYGLLLMAVFGWRNADGRIRGADGQYLPADFNVPGANDLRVR